MMPQPATEFSPFLLERLMNAAAVASILGVSIKTVHKLVREGKLGCVQITSKKRRFTMEQVQEFIERQSQPVRVDRRAPKPLSSSPKKGGQRSIGVSGTDLRKEMRSW